MGFFDFLRRDAFRFLGTDPSDLSETAATALAGSLLDAFAAQEPRVHEADAPTVITPSPVLVVRNGRVTQPASVLPRPMLARFWEGEALEIRADPDLPRYVGRICARLAEFCQEGRRDEFAKVVLEEIDRVYVNDAAPTRPWPEQDLRLRLVSLVLADVVRKIAAGFESPEVACSLGIGRGTHDDATRRKIERLRAEEYQWIAAAMAPAN
jgi:hypothetical protein